MKLPFGNSCSLPAVHPKDWKTNKAKTKNPWYIHYRFYTPDKPEGYRVKVVRKINTLDELPARRDAAKTLLEQVIESLNRGWNPILKQFVDPLEKDYEIEPSTPLTEALEGSLKRLNIEQRTRDGIRIVLTHVTSAARFLGCEKMQVKDVRKRHVKMILERIAATKPKWTASTFNHFRKYLSIVFKELVELDTIDHNPITAISKQKTVKKIRQVLTADERKAVDKHLKAKYRRFWLFTNIFFHSGSRETELLKVKGKDVNLEAQYFKVTIIKGSARREVMKTIKDVAVPFWKEALKIPAQKKEPAGICGPEQYVFGYRMTPHDEPITAHQISRRWRTNVKQQLGIEADFYSLKHSHSDEVAAQLGVSEAMKHNSHTNAGTTLIYAVNEQARQDDKIRKIGNKFA